MIEHFEIIEDFIYCKSNLQGIIIPIHGQNENNSPALENIFSDQINKGFDLIYKTFELLRSEVSKFIFKAKSEMKIKSHFRKIQLYIINLLSNSENIAHLFNYQLNLKNPLRLFALEKLEDFLRFLEDSFSEYLDANLKCPVKSKILMKYDIEQNLILIKNSLNARTLLFDYNVVVLKICDEAHKITQETYPNLKIVYRYSTVLEVLKNILNQEDTDFNFVKLYLLSIDYQDQTFVSSMKQELNENCIEEDNSNTLINLKFYLKNINQLNYKKIDFLFKNEQTTIALLSNFVKEEIAYFTNVQVDNSIENSAIRSSTQSLNSNTPESKIHFKLTVEQIAYFGKAMIESNIVDDSNKQELFKVASLFISSINQHQITHKSLSAKFYNPSQITIDTVRGLIIKMLNYTNK